MEDCSSIPSDLCGNSPRRSEGVDIFSIDSFSRPFDGIDRADVSNMKSVNSTEGLITAVNSIVPPNTLPTSQEANVAILTKEIPPSRNHAYSRVGVIKTGTYAKALLRSIPWAKGKN